MNIKIKPIITLFFSIFGLTCCASPGIKCDEDVTEIILNYDFKNETNVPGSSMTYNFLWKGYDTENLFGASVQEDQRYNTFLVSYSPKVLNYYFVYVDKEILSNYKTQIINFARDAGEYFFAKDDSCIDGRELLFLKKNNLLQSNYSVFTKDDLMDTPVTINGQRLICCFAEREITFIENVSKNKLLNKKIICYEKLKLKINPNAGKILEVLNNEHSGEKLEVYPDGIENNDYLYYPFLGLSNSNFAHTISVNIIDNKVELPYLDDDVYGDFEDLLREAFIANSVHVISNKGFAFYDLEKVKQIIRNAN